MTNTNPRPETADEWINAVIDGKLVNGEPVRVAELTEELMQSFGAVEARGDLPTNLGCDLLREGVRSTVERCIAERKTTPS